MNDLNKRGLAIISSSPAFRQHISTALDGISYHDYDSCERYLRSVPTPVDIVIVHASSLSGGVENALAELRSENSALKIAIASDRPGIEELLRLAANPIDGYCNSYMAAVHYHHMLRTLAVGESWFAPQLLPQMITLAQRGSKEVEPPAALPREILTAREEQIAEAIAEGLSNKSIAKRFAITERTVKAHLSSIYAKLEVRDRLALARHLLAS